MNWGSNVEQSRIVIFNFFRDRNHATNIYEIDFIGKATEGNYREFYELCGGLEEKYDQTFHFPPYFGNVLFIVSKLSKYSLARKDLFLKSMEKS